MGIRVLKTELDGVFIIEPDIYRDERGFFLESYHQLRYAEYGMFSTFVQDNHSQSRRGVLRGLHYQDMSAPMDKLVRCSFGRILDIVVDLRLGAPSFGRWLAVALSAEDARQLFVPIGFGHGFVTLSECAEIQYKCSEYYTPAAEGAVRWDDPELGIDWTISDPLVSARDQAAMSLAQYRERPAFVYKAKRT